MIDVLILILSTVGAIFILLAAIGVLRMPDIYLRISTSTKAATLGIGCILVATALFFNNVAITSRVVAIIFFVLLTSPISAHLVVRTAYFINAFKWKNTRIDELEGMYDKKKHTLNSGASEDDDAAETPDT